MQYIKRGEFKIGIVTIQYDVEKHKWYIKSKQKVPLDTAKRAYDIVTLLSSKNREEQLKKLIKLEIEENRLLQLYIKKRTKDNILNEQQLHNIEMKLADVIREKVIIKQEFLQKNTEDIY